MALVRFTRRPARLGFPFSSGSALSFDDMESRVNRFMERVLNQPFGASAAAETIGWVPAMDIVETPTEFLATAEIPGIDPKNVDVSVEDGVLTIRGEKTEERKEETEAKGYLFERSYGSFERSFALPATVDGAKITADFANGVLKVHLPKDGIAKPKGRKIEVKSET